MLIDVDAGWALSIAELVRNLPGILMVDVTTGPHEVIAVLDETDPASIAIGSIKKIQDTNGVRFVTTCLAVGPIMKNAEGPSIEKVNKPDSPNKTDWARKDNGGVRPLVDLLRVHGLRGVRFGLSHA